MNKEEQKRLKDAEDEGLKFSNLLREAQEERDSYRNALEKANLKTDKLQKQIEDQLTINKDVTRLKDSYEEQISIMTKDSLQVQNERDNAIRALDNLLTRLDQKDIPPALKKKLEDYYNEGMYALRGKSPKA